MKTINIFLISALTIGLATSCKKKGCTDPTAENYSQEAEKDDGSCTYPTEGTITLNFTHNVNGSNVTASEFDLLNYTNADGNVWSVTKLQYLISDVRFYMANGDSMMIEGYHLVDLDDTTTLSYVLPEAVPTNPFIGIGFTYGFDEVDNVDGAYADLNVASWSSPTMLGGGYHQLKFEGRFIDDMGDTMSFQYHNLSTIRKTTPDTTFHANYANMNLTNSFSFTGNTSIEIKMDLNEWFQNPITWDLDTYSSMLMPNYDAQVMMKQNSYSVFSVGAVTAE